MLNKLPEKPRESVEVGFSIPREMHSGRYYRYVSYSCQLISNEDCVCTVTRYDR